MQFPRWYSPFGPVWKQKSNSDADENKQTLVQSVCGMNTTRTRSDPSAASIAHYWSEPASVACSAVHRGVINFIITALLLSRYVLRFPSEPKKGISSSLHVVKQHVVPKTLPQSAFKGSFFTWLPSLDLWPKRLLQLWEDANSAGLVTKFSISQPNKFGLYKLI